MITLPLRLTAAALACALGLSLVACGGSDGGDEAGDRPAAGADGATDLTDPTDPAVADPVTEATDAGSADEAACVADSDELSGSSTVIWRDGDPVAERTLTFQDDGSLEPASLTVDVDEAFFVDHGPGTDLRAVKVGCAGAQTVPAGIVAGFVITAPGTYVIIDEAADGYAGAEVGSVTVE